MSGRKIKNASARWIIRNRLQQFAGASMPHTIAFKEIIDNAIDAINDRTINANKAHIKISKNRLAVMDDGPGLSTEMQDNGEFTHMLASITKMYSSSNYDGNKDTVGANGIGSKLFFLTANKVSVMSFNGRTVKGYNMTNGVVNGYKVDPETGKLTDIPHTDDQNIGDEEALEAENTGDRVNAPYSRQEAIELFNPPFEYGYFIDGMFAPVGSDDQVIFDDEVDINFLKNYIYYRISDIDSKKFEEIKIEIYEDDLFNNLIESFIYHKDKSRTNKETKKETISYVPSWEEAVLEAGSIIVDYKDGWRVALSTDSINVTSIIQGAPVDIQHFVSQSITIEDFNLSFKVPVSLYYRGDEYPKYTGQDKAKIRFPYSLVNSAFESNKAIDIYNHFYREAEKAYFEKSIAVEGAGIYYPVLSSDNINRDIEVVISEGFSAVDALKNSRDPMTQSCVAIRGKIKNCWDISMKAAMKSPVVKQILNVILNTHYNRIIIAVDADPDGSSIGMLLIGLIANFKPELLQKGKVFYAHTPYYVFSKRGQPDIYSDNPKDKPEGYTLKTLKGLSSLKSDEVERFILNKDTRDLWKIEWDENSKISLDFALNEGGKDWIVE